MHKAQRLINHVALVLDGSASMYEHRRKVVQVADDQIRHLAVRSEELEQETRVSVYLFNDTVSCLIFDMDVMRLPSIADLYRADGMTALVDATIKSQEDLATTSQIYGDHAFLTFVLTDGQENRSRNSWLTLSRNYFDRQRENWTIAFLVPDRQGEAYMRRIGAPSGNIAIWDTASASGLADAASTIRTATENFMVNRSRGVRGSSNVFSTGIDAVNTKTVAQSLKPLDNVQLYNVGPFDQRIDEYYEAATGKRYVKGVAYYQLTKTENIQPQKAIVVVNKNTGKAFGGFEARRLVGLPDTGTVRVKPDHNPEFDIFVQSTSLNRKLLANTKLLVNA